MMYFFELFTPNSAFTAAFHIRFLAPIKEHLPCDLTSSLCASFVLSRLDYYNSLLTTLKKKKLLKLTFRSINGTAHNACWSCFGTADKTETSMCTKTCCGVSDALLLVLFAQKAFPFTWVSHVSVKQRNFDLRGSILLWSRLCCVMHVSTYCCILK